jgi:hypothetical protein
METLNMRRIIKYNVKDETRYCSYIANVSYTLCKKIVILLRLISKERFSSDKFRARAGISCLLVHIRFFFD